MVKQTQSQATKVRKARLVRQAMKARLAMKKSKAKAKNESKAKAQKRAKVHKKELKRVNPNKSFLSNENKNFINAMFSVMIMSLIHRIPNFTFDDCFVGAFDGMERKTANTLIEMGFQQSAILLNELNETVARSHVSAGFPVHEGVDFGSDTHDEFYKEEGQAWRVYKCLGWYFDTCGEIGTQKYSLLSSIKKLVLIDGSVLAFTFCRSRVSVEEYKKEKRLFMKEVNGILLSRGLMLKVEHDHDYAGSSMFKRARESHMNSIVCSVVVCKK